MSKGKLHFYDKDSSGDWFMIPKNKEELWEHVKEMDEDDPKSWVAYEEFEQYRTGGDIKRIYFIPEEEKE